MAQVNNTSTLDGLFKTIYMSEGGPVQVIPDISYLQKRVPFKDAERIGKQYAFPVVLTNEAGVTYLASGAGNSQLNTSVAAVMKEAQVDAHQIILRGQMDYEAAAKAEKSQAAFKNASSLLIENLMATASKRLEIAMLYGRSPTGLGTADSSANVDSTNTNVTMLAAGWAPGIWSGAEGSEVNFYKVSDDSLVSSSTNAIFTVVSVNFSTRVIKFSGTSTGISALDTALGAGDCYIHFKNAKTAEPIGLDKIILNSGSLFNINAGDYSMWSGNTYSASSAALTVARILNAVALPVGKGGLMGEMDLLVSPKTFTNLSSSLNDLRKFEQNEKDAVAGFENIKVFGPNGKINIVPHPMIKEGEAIGYPPKKLKRVGSVDFTFNVPGRQDEFFMHVPDYNAYELRLYGAQQIVCECPAQMVKITAITNSN